MLEIKKLNYSYPDGKKALKDINIKIDDNDFNNEADYRIILFKNDKFLFETDDYDIIKDKKNIKFYNNLFYIDVDDIDDIIPFIDMGRIIYGDESKKILLQAKNLK